MQPQHKIAAGLLGIVMSLLAPAALADLLSEDSAIQAQYMEVQRNSEVYSLIGEHVIPVGEVKKGQLIQMFPADAEYYELKFGYGTGFIDKNDVRAISKTRKVKDDLGI